MKRVLLALGLAIVGSIGGSAAMPSRVAAYTQTWSYSCQTTIGDFAYNGGGPAAPWGVMVELTATGCWNATSSWTDGFSQRTIRSWYTMGYFEQNGAGSGPYYGDTLFWANYTEASVYYNCDPFFGLLCSWVGGNHGLYPRLRLVNLGTPNGASWYAETSCSLDYGADITGCSVSTPVLTRLDVRVYDVSGAPILPYSGMCSLFANKNAPVYQASGSTGYSLYYLPVPAYTQLWVSRSSQKRSTTWFLPILTGSFAGKLVQMSQIDIWGGTYWTGTCYP